ncbi:putative Centrosomal protein of 78 kDa [Daphnia magna]|uniref:Putative Centrosomal protein of 78 kDa n=1 Tax=Daphnia magna TaxID=35525 RepID=A0A0P5T3I0_9CRUS|nr:putative Centrosomal protein of 78 kDa [Daphnia magna]
MNFVSTYKRECLLKGTSPLHAIESSLADAILNFKFLRIPSSEWGPVLDTLKKNFSLKKICVNIDVLDLKSKNQIHMTKLKHLHPFIQSLLIHVSNSQHLTELFLVGIPFSVADLDCLTKGILNSNSLKHICFAESKIGDKGLAKIIEAVKAKPNIAWLDLRSCGLSDKVGKLLASLVSFQSVTRENAARKACLSAGDHNLDLMCGLRRLSLSGNSLSDAVGNLALALYEDRWIKAVDLQFCHLKDDHLNQFILAAENSCSLVYLDTSNNDGLNSTLVKRLKEVLEFNALKHPYVIQPISTSVSDCMVSNRRGQNIGHLHSSLKEMKLNTKILNLPIETRHEMTKNKEKGLNDGLVNDVSYSQLVYPRNDIYLRKILLNNAELQISQIHDEVRSVKAKIATLEEEVRELTIINKKPSGSMMISSSPKVVESNALSSPFTRSILLSLMRLQELLRELKITSAAPHHCEANVRSQDIQVILDVVYAAVRQFDPKTNRAKLSEKYATVATENHSLRGTTKTVNYKAERTGKYCENPSGDFHQVCQGQIITPDKENTTITEDLSTLSRAMSLVESLFHGHSPMNDPSQILQDPSTISLQDSSRNITSNFRVNSLKSLQTSLEGLRQQLDGKKDISLDQRNFIPELTDSRNICDFTSQEQAGSHYSTCFNSFCTSSASSRLISKSSIEMRTEVSNDYLPHSDTKQSKKVCLDKESIPSPLSSTIDLSSIVDLLGNFSIDDIGSSTLTPP